MPIQTISADEYKAILQEREELVSKRDSADSEFMFLHYQRMLSVMNDTYERATRLNIKLENREAREKAKVKREELARRKSS